MKHTLYIALIMTLAIAQACNDGHDCDLPALGTRSSCTPPDSQNGFSSDELIAQYILDNNLTGVETTSTGLQYRIVETGDSDMATSDDSVLVDYVGYYRNGCQFDANNELSFPLSGVIAGWTEGMQLVGTCGTIQLFISPSLAYGDNPNNGIAAGEPLIFDVNMLAVE